VSTAGLLVLLLALFSAPAFAGEAPRLPETYELKLVHIFEGPEPKHIFVIGESGFTSVKSLKEFLGQLPAGSEIRWAPGCTRFGKEPLLSSEKDMGEFRAFLEKKGLKLVVVPSG
jgi:hypothetical protein